MRPLELRLWIRFCVRISWRERATTSNVRWCIFDVLKRFIVKLLLCSLPYLMCMKYGVSFSVNHTHIEFLQSILIMHQKVISLISETISEFIDEERKRTIKAKFSFLKVSTVKRFSATCKIARNNINFLPKNELKVLSFLRNKFFLFMEIWIWSEIKNEA